MRKTYFILLAVSLVCSSCISNTPLITIGEFMHTKIVDMKIGHLVVIIMIAYSFKKLWER